MPADLDQLHSRAWMLAQIRAAIPPKLPPIIEWAEREIKVFGVKGEHFAADNTPWTRYPIELCDRIGSIRSITFIKPVQTGGSVVGEIAACRWIIKGFGEIQWNWDTDDYAKDRWDKRLEKILKACRSVRQRWPAEGQDRFKAKKCLVVFPNLALNVQGVFNPDSLDSDSIPFQINEEIHKWKPGHLDKAYRRGTACAFPIALNISNASCHGDQLFEAWRNGTQQFWEVKCPGCGQYHIMRTQWDEKHPELGGLRYDTEGCKREDGTFNYNKLAPTLRYQMPCGHVVRDDVVERKNLSLSGRYSAPFNDGALASDVSLTYQAVTSHDINWLQLVKEKHTALRSLRAGDDSAWKKYLQERECQFYSKDNRPFDGQIIINQSLRKNREGLPARAVRAAVFDWQQGYKHKGQLIHYWGTICDFTQDCHGQLVFEGKVNSEAELIALVKEYEVDPAHVLIDASKNTKQILQLCYQQGFKAVAGYTSHLGHFNDHPDKVKRFYSAGKPIHAQLNVPPVYEYVFGERQDSGTVPMVPDPREPIVIEFNKGGVLGLLFFYREMKARVTANCAEENPPRTPEPNEYMELVIPGDVSEEFLKQYDSWEPLLKDARAKPGDVRSPNQEAFRQVAQDDHMLMTIGYTIMYLDWSFLLGDALANLGLKPQAETAESE